MLQDTHGKSHAHRRLRALCRTLLKRMAPEHKFATAARLCSEVLSGFADGALSLGAAPEVLRDALHILASKDVKVGLRPGLAPVEPPASLSLLHGAFLLPVQSLENSLLDLVAIIWGSAQSSDSPRDWRDSQVTHHVCAWAAGDGQQERC